VFRNSLPNIFLFALEADLTVPMTMNQKAISTKRFAAAPKEDLFERGQAASSKKSLAGRL